MTPPIPSGSADADVIARVLAGDTAAFQLLVTRYQEPLFRIAYSMVRDSDVASDLVQDAFVRAYVNLARCRKRDRFRVWLITLLRNPLNLGFKSFSFNKPIAGKPLRD